MITDKRVLIVIPALNEAGSVAQVIKEVHNEVPTAGVLVVDDGSTDATVQAAAEAGAHVAVLPYHLGVGGAMRLGYKYARDEGYDVVVQIDGDGQHDPRYVPDLIAALDDADLVIGARFAGVGEYRSRGPRRWAMRMLAMVCSRIAKTKLTDTTSGFRAAGRPLIELYAKAYPVEYLGDTVEALVLTLRRGYRVRQIPVAMRARMAGQPSHSPLKATIYLGRAFAVLMLALVRR